MAALFLGLLIAWQAIFPAATFAATSAAWTRLTSDLPNARTYPAAAVGPDGRIYVTGGADNVGGYSTVEAYDPKSEAWTTMAPMTSVRAGHASATGVDGRVYVFGGMNGVTFIDANEAYDTRTNTWAAVPSMATTRVYSGAATGKDGRIYVVGGQSRSSALLNSVEAYTPGTSTWATVAPMPTPWLQGAVAAGNDGRIYVLGGHSGDPFQYQPLNTVDVYDPDTNTWTSAAPMSTARDFVAATAAPDGRIYAIGGSSGSRALSTVEAYDPQTNLWQSVPSLLEPRAQHSAVTGLDGQLYVAGGVLDGNGGFAHTVEVYGADTPSSNTWTRVPDLSSGRTYPSAAAGSDGRVYAIGGNSNITSDCCALDVVQAYDPGTNTWTTKAPMPTARGALASVTGPDGRIYAIGGYNRGIENTVAVYDPRTDTWTGLVAQLPSFRAYIGAAVGKDGRIYVLGDSSTAVDAYDPRTDVWTSVAPLPSTHFQGGVTAGKDGRIYAIGGSSAGTVTANVDVYDPATNAWSSVAPLMTPRSFLSAATGWPKLRDWGSRQGRAGGSCERRSVRSKDEQMAERALNVGRQRCIRRHCRI